MTTITSPIAFQYITIYHNALITGRKCHFVTLIYITDLRDLLEAARAPGTRLQPPPCRDLLEEARRTAPRISENLPESPGSGAAFRPSRNRRGFRTVRVRPPLASGHVRQGLAAASAREALAPAGRGGRGRAPGSGAKKPPAGEG